MNHSSIKKISQFIGCHPGAGPAYSSPPAGPGWQPSDLAHAARHYLRLRHEAEAALLAGGRPKRGGNGRFAHEADPRGYGPRAQRFGPSDS